MNLRKTNGAGLTECADDNAENQKSCSKYDDRHRADAAKHCFRFRNWGADFWLCDLPTTS